MGVLIICKRYILPAKDKDRDVFSNIPSNDARLCRNQKLSFPGTTRYVLKKIRVQRERNRGIANRVAIQLPIITIREYKSLFGIKSAARDRSINQTDKKKNCFSSSGAQACLWPDKVQDCPPRRGLIRSDWKNPNDIWRAQDRQMLLESIKWKAWCQSLKRGRRQQEEPFWERCQNGAET